MAVDPALRRRREAMRSRLPHVWRPDAAEGEGRPDPEANFGAAFLQMVASLLAAVDEDVGEVLRSRWWSTADRGLYSPYLILDRSERGEPPPHPEEESPGELKHVRDLARLGALLGVDPWHGTESVASYRRRLQQTVALYRNGTGTLAAVARAVEASLPAPAGELPLAFEINERAPMEESRLEAPSQGPPERLLGPLMSWTVRHEGDIPVSPSVVVEAGPSGAIRPLVERLPTADGEAPLAVGYRGDLTPGQAIRFRPAYRCWTTAADELRRGDSLPNGQGPAIPGDVNGWAAVEDGPDGDVRALAAPQGGHVWAGGDGPEGQGQLWRFDGHAWMSVADGLPAVRCLRTRQHALLVGTDEGALRVDPYAENGPSLEPVAALEGRAVNDFLRGRSGTWAATDAGLMRLIGEGEARPAGPWAEDGEDASAFALYEDRSGLLFVGTTEGVVRHHPAPGHWYRLRARIRADVERDWAAYPSFAPKGHDLLIAGDESASLPPVRALQRGPDEMLWIGTDSGPVRYTAHAAEQGAYTTRLEAYPDVCGAPVGDLSGDESGALWLATGSGLLRFDGREFWLEGSEGRRRLGRAATLDGGALVRAPEVGEPPLRGAWSWDSEQGRWLRLAPEGGDWQPPELWERETGDRRPVDAEGVRAVAFTDRVVAELGRVGEDGFAAEESVPPEQLVSRRKASPTRAVDAGVPAVPRVPPGTSMWRYLSLEGEDPGPDEAPGWSKEGRLVVGDADELDAVPPGRFDGREPAEHHMWDRSVFAYEPEARVTLSWRPRRPLRVRVRLRPEGEDSVGPAVLDRVWTALNRVRPAGSRAELAVDRRTVRPRGEDDA